MGSPAMTKSEKDEDRYSMYAQPIVLTTAELITAVRFGRKKDIRANMNLLLLNLAEMCDELGYREAAMLHDASDSFDRG